MNIEKHYPYSRILDQTMPISVYGHYGTPLLFFPTASADFEELERHGMIGALAHHINAGRIKIFSIDSINRQSWFNHAVSVPRRIERQAQYDRYIVDEFLPFVYHHCHGKLPVATAGASLGAFHASNTLFRHPDLFRWCICMSGIYDLSEYFEGYFDHNCFSQNPTSYLSHLPEPHRRELSRCSINIICGQGPWERVHWSRRIHELLLENGLPHTFDLWGYDVAHDWPWWFKQMDLYIQRLFAQQ